MYTTSPSLDRGDVDPVRPGLERVRDLRRVDTDVVVVVPPRERVHPGGPERDRSGRVRRRLAERAPEGDEPFRCPRTWAVARRVPAHPGEAHRRYGARAQTSRPPDLAYYIAVVLARSAFRPSGTSPQAQYAAARPPAPRVTNAQPHVVGDGPGAFVRS